MATEDSQIIEVKKKIDSLYAQLNQCKSNLDALFLGQPRNAETHGRCFYMNESQLQEEKRELLQQINALEGDKRHLQDVKTKLLEKDNMLIKKELMLLEQYREMLPMKQPTDLLESSEFLYPLMVSPIPQPASRSETSASWRSRVANRYTGGKEVCMVLSQVEGCGSYGEVVAAHIWPKSLKQRNGALALKIDVDEATNGLMLSKHIEEQYDKGNLAFIPRLPKDHAILIEIVVASCIMDNEIYTYNKSGDKLVQGRPLNLKFSSLNGRLIWFMPKPSLRALLSMWWMAYGLHPNEFEKPGCPPMPNSIHIAEWLMQSASFDASIPPAPSSPLKSSSTAVSLDKETV